LWVLIGPTTGKAIDTATGAFLSSGGAWTNSSDAALKDEFAPVDVSDVLGRVARLPIKTWRYRADSAGGRHIGPVAQDFHHAFGLGHDTTSIATVDADGVALAAIQGLNAKLEAEVMALRAELAAIRKLLVQRR
jgi:hypothetical protein